MSAPQWTPQEISYFLNELHKQMQYTAKKMKQCKPKNPADQMALHAHANELDGAAGIALKWAKEIEEMDSKDTEADNRQQHEENQWEARNGR